MANVSPGVYVKFVDLSEYVQNVPSTIGFIAIISEKGPDNEMIRTNSRDFFIDFGEPNIAYAGRALSQGPYVAANFLKQSDALYVIRVMPEDSAFANLVFVGEDTSNYGVDGTSTVTVSSVSGVNTEDEIYETINYDESDSTGTAALMFFGWGRGAWYNNYKISVSEHANPIRASEGVYNLDIWQRQNALEYDATSNEWVEDFQIVQTFEVSFNPNKLDNSGNSMFVADIMTLYFKDIVCIANRDMCLEMCDSGTDWSEPFVSGPIRLQNGSDGSLLTEGATLLANAYAGQLPRARGYAVNPVVPQSNYVDDILNTEDYYINVVLDGGYSADVKNQIVSLCRDSRQDCVAILDNGDNKSVTESIYVRQNVNTFNTFYAALYECYTNVYDLWSGRDIWITPVYHIASVIPYTDKVSELWYAPAGFNRGSLSGIKKMRFNPILADRDSMYLEQINPIVKFHAGFVVWGQLTTQRRPTAYQDLNIVRLLLYIKRALSEFCKYYVYEMNDSMTWAAIASNVDKFLKVIQDKRGLYSYGVDVGATEYEIKAKKIHVNVSLKPTRVVEQIDLTFFVS